MTPDLGQIDFYKVVFWVIIVLVAGFIGQFGKSFAKYLMDRFGKKPPQGPAKPQMGLEQANRSGIKKEPSAAPPAGPAMSREESKLRKKEIKAELKRKKKEGK